MKLALDHHYSPLIAAGLRDRGHDARAIYELGWQAEGDESLLRLCNSVGRSLMTNNVADFTIIARRWQDEGLSHAGLLFTADSGWPRHRGTIGRFVDALDILMRQDTTSGANVDRTHWL